MSIDEGEPRLIIIGFYMERPLLGWKWRWRKRLCWQHHLRSLLSF